MQQFKQRLRAACRTSEPQASTTFGLSVVTVAAMLLQPEPGPWWVVVAFGLFWPAVAFIANFVDPLP